ncbi:hypothetical protein [Bacillus niameyensis]|uniref:hypothetical protein n=1 Tax=Bacillus niameyensis TaxID=1522308 RepID=UPI0007802F8B|nr:hypothetical protein [Bacillus niameyensis]
MSLKSIEMQVALPRTVEAGKVSEQLQQRGQLISDQANEEMTKQIEQDRRSVKEMSEQEKLHLKQGSRDGQNDHKHNEHDKKQKDPRKDRTKDSHPYKGKTIDYSG